jgi:AcrR family transcriptional regulator
MERKLKSSIVTVQKLHQSMIRLLKKQEYEKISVAGIAKEAGLNRTTFYLFYSSKEDLIYDICNTFLDEYIEIFRDALDKNAKEQEEKSCQKAFENLSKHEKVIKALWNIQEKTFNPYKIMEKSVASTVYQFLEKEKIQMKNGGQADFFANLYAANVMATVKWWIYNYQDFTIGYVHGVIKDCHEKGLLSLLENKKS